MTFRSILGHGRLVRAQRVRHPWRPVVYGALFTCLVAATVVLIGTQRGYPSTSPRLLSGAAWLPSAQVGQMTLLDGSSAEVAAQVQASAPGEHLDVVQWASTGYAVNTTTGTIRRVDGATFRASEPTSPISGSREGLRAFVGAGDLYLLDIRSGALVGADPRSLTTSGKPMALAGQSEQTTTVGQDGRLWTLDPATGDLSVVDDGRRATHRQAVRAGADIVMSVNGTPIVVDVSRRAATVVDPDSGKATRTIGLDLAADDTVKVGQSPNDSRFHLITSHGRLITCDLTRTACHDAVLLNAAGEFGAPVEAGGRVFVPDYTSGNVWIVDPFTSKLVAQPKVLTPGVRFQLLVRDGVVFFNDPDSPNAGVIHLDGSVRTVSKYDSGDPSNGRTRRNPSSSAPGASASSNRIGAQSPRPSSSAATSPARPSSASQPSSTQPPSSSRPGSPAPSTSSSSTPPPVNVQLKVSAESVRVSQVFGAQVVVTGGAPSSITWYLGDGATETGPSITHTWTSVGTYLVSVVVTVPGQSAISTAASIRVTARPVLTVQVHGPGTVTGENIACPSTCSSEVDWSHSVTLSAVADSGSITPPFPSWSSSNNSCSGETRRCTVNMMNDVTITVTFPTTSTP